MGRSYWIISIMLLFSVAALCATLVLLIRWRRARWWPQRSPLDRGVLAVANSSSGSSFETSLSEILKTLRTTMVGRKLVVFANRQPYIHQNCEDGSVKVMRPASGLVTALEPILRQSGGLWIAHGNGSADRQIADGSGRVAVPPEDPRYTLQRVWLSEAEENGYYYGFSNEGLWPLAHLAHTRPVFRLNDWRHYQDVNQRFCDSLASAELRDDSLILVQDYHFALLPRMIRSRIKSSGSAARVALFWHIPWPNPETFGICPWANDLLKGILGADVVGFHTQFHCNNFLQTCDRYLEARVDWEHFSVTMDGHETLVRAFPIGIATTPVPAITSEERSELKKRYGLNAELIAVGVDRIDYTKGLLERVESVERFFEKFPQYLGKFTFGQIGSPSRSNIPAYHELHAQLERNVQSINRRFGFEDHEEYVPIRFLPIHHGWEEIQRFYQLGDVCLVTSLHDGMNLVAKEYIWCQKPESGSLVLSKFAGASRELSDALIVNPYSIEEMANAIEEALRFTPAEKFRRMSRMREKISDHNAFHWANEIIQTLVKDVRRAQPPSTPATLRRWLLRAS